MLYFGGFYYLSAIALVSFAATYEVAHVITRKGSGRWYSPSMCFRWRIRSSTIFSG